MSGLKNKIKQAYLKLSPTNKLISDALLEYADKKTNLTIAMLAKKSYCSNSAIMKYINFFGYTSYKVFLSDLMKEKELKYQNFLNSFMLVDDYLETNQTAINHFINKIKSSKKVYLFAAGQSQISAIDFRTKCNKIEKQKYVFESNITMQELLITTLSPDDLIIFISNSGEARELIAFSSQLKNNHKILITNRANSKLSKLVDAEICLRNIIESPLTFKEYSRESKYTLLYFFDRIFELLYLRFIH